jgi:hypothetical protein
MHKAGEGTREDKGGAGIGRANTRASQDPLSSPGSVRADRDLLRTDTVHPANLGPRDLDRSQIHDESSTSQPQRWIHGEASNVKSDSC